MTLDLSMKQFLIVKYGEFTTSTQLSKRHDSNVHPSNFIVLFWYQSPFTIGGGGALGKLVGGGGTLTAPSLIPAKAANNLPVSNAITLLHWNVSGRDRKL
mgnify:CR=1 FL=1